MGAFIARESDVPPGRGTGADLAGGSLHACMSACKESGWGLGLPLHGPLLTGQRRSGC